MALIVESAMAPRRMMLTGVARYMQEHEPWLIYLKPYGAEKFLSRWLMEWRGDGIIAAIRDRERDLIVGTGIPVVDVAGGVPDARVPLVHANDQAIGRLGAEHLLERGLRSFGFCEYRGEFWSADRREGFVSALAEQKTECRVYLMEYPRAGTGGPDTWEKQQQELAEWLLSLPRPVGIMASTDLMGQQLLEACLRLGLDVPEAVAVLGVDDDEPICRLAAPPLSSVIVNDHQRGYEAAALLDRLMAGEPPPTHPILIEPVGVRTRASTDIVAIDDPALAQTLRFLRDNACDRISVDDVVKQVPLSRSVLERRFRRHLGRSINSEIIRLRLNKAVELLSETTLELKVIAQRAGFGTQSYMSAVFKGRLGKTPGSFRRAGKMGAPAIPAGESME